MTNRRFIVTGGAGFIGSALVRHLVRDLGASVLVVDKLTYAGVPESLSEVGLDSATLASSNPRLSFLKADICDTAAMAGAFAEMRPNSIFHLAAESHVDRSIDGPGEFVRTNVTGTASLLQAALAYWKGLPAASDGEPSRETFRFQHISTDEVYGALGETGFFTENTPYSPHSPYSASKAASDHLVRAWHDTYGLPTLITNCSNNYGPYHFPEKLIPLMIANALNDRPLPAHGKGENVRDWLYVEDHCKAIDLIIHNGTVGQVYNIGGHNEMKNIDIVKLICKKLNKPESLIRFVADRKGHDLRYAIDPTKIHNELGWLPETRFADGIDRTIDWYLNNTAWWENIISGEYRNYYERMYGNR